MRKNTFLNASKVLFAVFAVLFAVFAFPASVLAENALYYDDYEVDKRNRDTGNRLVICDAADLLSDSEIKKLAEDMSPLTQYGSVAFVTTDINDYHDIMDYSEEMFYSIFDNHEDATMLIIDMDEREISIYSDGDMHDIITDGYAYDITGNIYTYATRGDYYTCASKAFDQMNAILGGHKILRPMRYVCSVFLGLLVSFLINFLIVSKASKIQNTGSAEMLSGAYKTLRFTTPTVCKTGESRTYSPVSESSGGGGGGGSRGGGGGGGGHSGGGGHHGF